MKSFFIGLLLLPLCLFGEEIQEAVTGMVFPSEITIDYQGKKYELASTGVTSLKMLGFKIYAISHYLDKNAPKGAPYQIIYQDNLAKQFTLKYLIGASASRVQKGIDDSFKKSLQPSEYGQLSDAIRYYISLFDLPLKKGDEQIVRWLPGGQVQLLINGQEAGTFTHTPFAIALWNLWFGPTSSIDPSQLISRLPQQ